jgi:serine/threonine protein kinase/gas vesicle protein
MPDPAFPDALPALSRLHWYVVERVLGQGGFGITYLARDTNLDQMVAIKEYLPVDVATRMNDATIRSRSDDLRDRYRWGLERFIQEARTLARFDHPNIVRVQSVFEFNNTAYMVMRFEQGLTLSALLDRRGTLPERELQRIVLPILDGLELVHGAGFIHRDIKPDNIHINDDGDPVLLDFGSARQSLGNSHTLTILIAPGYAPFEQYYSDSSSQGPWTDIYGLGATCYRAISGRPPLDAVSRSKGILGSTQEVLVPASVIGAGRYSGSFLAAVDHALAFSEKDRPQTIAAWRQELVAGQTQLPLATELAKAPPTAIAAPVATASPIPADAAKPETQTAKPREPADATQTVKPESRRPRIVGFVIGVAILALGVAVFLAMRTGNEARDKIVAMQKALDDEHEKQKNEDAARKRDDQARADAAEAARKRELERASQEEQKRQEEQKEQKRREKEAAKPIPIPNSNVKPKQAPTERTQPPAASPSVPLPVASREVPGPQASAPSVAPPPTTSPESSKPVPPRTPAEQIADSDRAIAAKQYAEALAILKPLADAGSGQAQSRLGNLYAEGLGVQRDYSAAREWYDKAARQGDINAALKLGAMYASGTGTDRNSYLAYVYDGMAARLGSNSAKPEMEKAAASMQPAERQQADRLIESIVSKMAKKQ